MRPTKANTLSVAKSPDRKKSGPTPKRTPVACSSPTRKGAPHSTNRKGESPAALRRKGESPAALSSPAGAQRRALRAARWCATRLGQWVGAFAFGLVSLMIVQAAAGTGNLSYALAAYSVPAVATLLLRPASRRRLYRFPVPLVLSYTAYGPYQVTIYLLTTVWIIRQCWFVDTDPRDKNLGDVGRLLLRRPAR